VKAVAPLAELLGYRSELRELAQERAECTIQFLRREQVPRLGAAGEHSTGVPANKPVVPKLGRGSAAADLPSE
jgi:translation elongation factor EF-G